MNKIVLPLLMYKEKGSVRKGTKKKFYVVPTWNHLYTIVKRPVIDPITERKKYILQPILDKWALLHKDKMIDILTAWKEDNHWETTQDMMVIVKVWVYWNDNRKKDCHNLDKLFMDAMNNIIYDDDANALLQYHYFDIDRENPRIEIELDILDKVYRKNKTKSKKTLKKKEG